MLLYYVNLARHGRTRATEVCVIVPPPQTGFLKALYSILYSSNCAIECVNCAVLCRAEEVDVAELGDAR